MEVPTNHKNKKDCLSKLDYKTSEGSSYFSGYSKEK